MIKCKVQLPDGGRAFITEFNTEQELHKAARTWLAGAKIRKLNPKVRSALCNKSMKSVWKTNQYLASAAGNM